MNSSWKRIVTGVPRNVASRCVIAGRSSSRAVSGTVPRYTSPASACTSHSVPVPSTEVVSDHDTLDAALRTYIFEPLAMTSSAMIVGDDLLEAADDWARISSQALDFLYEVSGFDHVTAIAGNDGNTSDVTDPLAFTLEMDGPW